MVPAQVLQRIHGELVMHISAFVRTDDAVEQLGRHDKPLRQILKGANELVEYQKGRHVYKVIFGGMRGLDFQAMYPGTIVPLHEPLSVESQW